MRRIGAATSIIVFGPAVAYIFAAYIWIPMMVFVGLPENLSMIMGYAMTVFIYLWSVVYSLLYAASQFFK